LLSLEKKKITRLRTHRQNLLDSVQLRARRDLLDARAGLARHGLDRGGAARRKPVLERLHSGLCVATGIRASRVRRLPSDAQDERGHEDQQEKELAHLDEQRNSSF
jgi:hypothetical protein